MKRLTDAQKTAIRDSRAAGLGYKAIAEKLSLSRETVRSFCSRNDIPSKRDANTSVTETKASTEMKQGGTVFIITTLTPLRSSPDVISLFRNPPEKRLAMCVV